MQTIALQRKSERRSWDRNAALLLALLLAEGSVIYTSYHIGRTEGLEASGSFVSEFPYTLEGLHLWITLGVIVSAIGLWWRGTTGLALSFVTLIFVFGIYGFWHFRTQKYLSEFSTDTQLYNRLRTEVGLFHGATKWDFVVLFVAATLLLWQVTKLVLILRRRRGSAKS